MKTPTDPKAISEVFNTLREQNLHKKFTYSEMLAMLEPNFGKFFTIKVFMTSTDGKFFRIKKEGNAKFYAFTDGPIHYSEFESALIEYQQYVTDKELRKIAKKQEEKAPITVEVLEARNATLEVCVEYIKKHFGAKVMVPFTEFREI